MTATPSDSATAWAPDVDPFAEVLGPAPALSPHATLEGLEERLSRIIAEPPEAPPHGEPATGSGTAPVRSAWQIPDRRYADVRVAAALQAVWAGTPGPWRHVVFALPWASFVPPTARLGDMVVVATHGDRHQVWVDPAVVGALVRLHRRSGASPANVVFPLTLRRPTEPISPKLLKVLLTYPVPTSGVLDAYLDALADLPTDDQPFHLRHCLQGRISRVLRERLADLHPEVLEGWVDAEVARPAEAPKMGRPALPIDPRGLGRWLEPYREALESGQVQRLRDGGTVRTLYTANLISMLRHIIYRFEAADCDADALDAFLSLPAQRNHRVAWATFMAWAQSRGATLPLIRYPVGGMAPRGGATASTPTAPAPDASTPSAPPVNVTLPVPGRRRGRSGLATRTDFPLLPEYHLRPRYTALAIWNGSMLVAGETPPPTPPSASRIAKPRQIPTPAQQALGMQQVHQMLQGTLPSLVQYESGSAWDRVLMAFVLWAVHVEGYSPETTTEFAKSLRWLLDDLGGSGARFHPSPPFGHPLVTALTLDQLGSTVRQHERWVWNRFAAFAEAAQVPWAWLFPRCRPRGIRALDAMPGKVRRAMAWLLLWKRVGRPRTGRNLADVDDRYTRVLSVARLRHLPASAVVLEDGVPVGIRFEAPLASGLDTTITLNLRDQEQEHVRTLLAWRAGFPGTAFDPATVPLWPYGKLTDQDPLLVPYPGVPMPFRLKWLMAVAREASREATQAALG